MYTTFRDLDNPPPKKKRERERREREREYKLRVSGEEQGVHPSRLGPTGLDDKSERFLWFFDDKMKNIQPIFTKIDTWKAPPFLQR